MQSLADQAGGITYEQCVILRRALACYAWITDRGLRQIESDFPGVTIGSIRNTASVCSWLIAFLGDLAQCSESDGERARELRELAERLTFGASKESLNLCYIAGSGLSRDERNHLANKDVRTIDDVLGRGPNEIPLPRKKALRLISAAERTIQDKVEKRKRYQVARLRALGVDTGILVGLYEADGTSLEDAVGDILSKPFLKFVCQPIRNQKRGEPDHLIYDANKKVIAVQTTAREKKNVSMTKAVTVIGQSARYKPSGYIVFGRPDFEKLAIVNAEEQVADGKNYKLIPIHVLGEMFVLFREGRLSAEGVGAILTEWTGYITVKDMLKKLEADGT